jgi:phosphoribosylaminoimidazolecarboxamide formyltransferase/IMP cyclohydrolase
VRALISVSDKSGIVDFARSLVALDISIISTGNTQRVLQEAGIDAQPVSSVTGFPEILDGRVKTLHPAIHAGILARRDQPAHADQLAEHGLDLIDIVVVNLYPFRETVARPQTTLAEATEQIDIGGVALLRAAAKNAPDVMTLIDPLDYPAALDELREGRIDPDLRRRLAAKTFAHTATYDTAIATYLAGETFPPTLNMAWPLAQPLRYGENPHQPAALYGDFFSHFTQLHGKELSYNNILDTAAAQELIEEFPAAEAATVAIIKHTNPCGVGSADTLIEAWEKAFATDRDAPFGGIISTNRPVDVALAQAINEIFSEIVIAPDFEPDALALLKKKKNRRLLRGLAPVSRVGDVSLRSVPGGVLAQVADREPLAGEETRSVTQREPTVAEWQALRFAWRVVKHVKSNAIVYCAADRTLGIGAGQMSRVDSSRLAVWKAAQAGLSLQGSVVGSDALFPFADGVEAALAAGATAVIQPGGAMRDEEVIAACNTANAAMVFTGRRHFRH